MLRSHSSLKLYIGILNLFSQEINEIQWHNLNVTYRPVNFLKRNTIRSVEMAGWLVNNEFKSIWKWPWPNLRHDLGMCLDGLRKTTNISIRIGGRCVKI
jgi:hypothetical protein